MSTIFDPMDRAQTPLVADEKTMLLGMLAFQRDTLRWKCSGLTAEQLAFEHAPSALSLGGLLKHLAVVEFSWVRMTFAGGDDSPAWRAQQQEGQDGWSFRTTAGETPQVLFDWLAEAQRLTERIVGDAPRVWMHCPRRCHTEVLARCGGSCCTSCRSTAVTWAMPI